MLALTTHFYLLQLNTTLKMDSNPLHDVAGSLELYSSGPNLDTEVKLHDAMPLSTNAIACSFSVGHSNQIGYLSFGECPGV